MLHSNITGTIGHFTMEFNEWDACTCKQKTVFRLFTIKSKYNTLTQGELCILTFLIYIWRDLLNPSPCLHSSAYIDACQIFNVSCPCWTTNGFPATIVLFGTVETV